MLSVRGFRKGLRACDIHWPAFLYFGGPARCFSLSAWWNWIPIVYFEKNRVFKAGVFALNTLAWDNGIGHWFYFVGLRTDVMINRNSWGHSYSMARGEILGFMEDELLRKHLSKMFSLIKNES